MATTGVDIDSYCEIHFDNNFVAKVGASFSKNIGRGTKIFGDKGCIIINDTWFGASIGPEQHLEIAQSRAHEHQKSLIRATNSGISAIIDRKGSVVNRQGFFEDKQIKQKVFIYEGKTPFSVVGNWFIYGYIMLIYMYLLLYKRTNVL